MKDKPGPTCLIGGPSIPASELLAQVSAMGTFTWDGVRDEPSNAFLKKMRPGDISCLFHGGAMERAVVGQLEVASEPRPDASAWDPDSPCAPAGGRARRRRVHDACVHAVRAPGAKGACAPRARSYFGPESPEDNPKWFCVDVKARSATACRTPAALASQRPRLWRPR
jgi:predicted RNA-binding protein with PUA-like domain